MTLIKKSKIGTDQAFTGMPEIRDGLIALGLGIFSLFIYVRTLVPGLLPGDSGEFQTLAFTVGHAHTPGYETFILLAKLFSTLVSIRDMAYRINLLSAFCGALTVAFVYLAGSVLSRSRWAGGVAAFALAISATFWSQSIIAEVYTPGSAFTSAILFLVLLWYQTRRARLLFIAGLLGGLAIEVHTTNSLFAPAIAVLLVLCWKDLGKTWKPALSGAIVGAALTFLAFIIVDAHPAPSSTIHAVYQPSITRWDLPANYMDGFSERLQFLILARQWRSAMFRGDPQLTSSNFDRLMEFLPNDFAFPIQLLVPIGLIALFARRWRLGIFFSVAILVHLIYTLNYQIGDIYVFFISLYVYLMPLAAEGLAVFLRMLSRLPRAGRLTAQPALALVFIVLAGAPFYTARMDALKNGEIRFDFMKLMSNRQLQGWHALLTDTVHQLPENAIVLTDWEKLYGYYYVAEIEQNRYDLSFLETYPYSTQQGLSASLFPFLKDNIENGRPVLAEWDLEEVNRGGLAIQTAWIGSKRMYQIVMH